MSKSWESETPISSAANRLEKTGTEEGKKAIAKAMHVLLYRQRSEAELRKKLAEKDFSEAAIEEAVAYVRSYGYLDDARFAEVYLHSMREKKSHALIRRELREKGVATSVIDRVMETEVEDESDTVYALLQKKLGQPHPLSEKEVRRTTAYLARKGFSSAYIWKAIRRFQDPENDPSFLV